MTPLSDTPREPPVSSWTEYTNEILSHESWLRARLWSYTRNRSDLDELMQETYAHLLTLTPEAIRDIRSVRYFALAVGRNIALDIARRREVLTIEHVGDLDELFEDIQDAQCFPLEQSINDEQEVELLLVGLKQLPERCRQVFTLRKVFGLSQKEIADKLGIAENTVEAHLTKALRRLFTDFGSGDLVLRSRVRVGEPHKRYRRKSMGRESFPHSW
jgi:RNA polymerase sigma factor (sigma-70 family)